MFVESINQAYGSRMQRGTMDLYKAKIAERCRNESVLGKTYEMLIEKEDKIPSLATIITVYQSQLPNRSNDQSLPAWHGLEDIEDDCIKCDKKLTIRELMRNNGCCPDCKLEEKQAGSAWPSVILDHKMPDADQNDIPVFDIDEDIPF